MLDMVYWPYQNRKACPDKTIIHQLYQQKKIGVPNMTSREPKLDNHGERNL